MKVLSWKSALLLTLCLGCNKTITTIISNTVQEEAYCTTTGSFTGTTVTIQGHAQYHRRELTVGAGLAGQDPGGPFDIRYAEYQVLDSTGKVVHCGETDTNGDYSFSIPSDNTIYTIKVNSRSYNILNKASVVNSPYEKLYYSLTTTVTATGVAPITAPTVTAAYNGDVKGGAFNILDKILDANLFLKTHSSFTVDHKVTAFWAKGVNPTTYIGQDPDSGLSFYRPGTSELYILGGIAGDVNSEDTDHFDDSIIVHEFGHFIEDNYAVADSPGGYHNGKRIMDPRLVWSEAFATFLMAEVLKSPVYRDTIGNSDGFATYAINYNIETNTSTIGTPKLDTPVANSLGEGNFREFAVCRTLVDLFDNVASGLADTDADGVTLPFSDFWDTFTGTFKDSGYFADAGRFFELLDTAVVTDFSAILTDDDHETQASRLEYGFSNTATVGQPDLIAGGGDSNCEWTIEAEDQVASNPNGRDELIDDGSDPSNAAGSLGPFQVSNQLKSNDFFYYYHPGGTLTVRLEYTPTSSTKADLDLYIYKTDYTFGNSSRMLAYSNNPNGENGSSPDDNGVETVSVNAPAGQYMINIMYWTSGEGSRVVASTAFFDTATYYLKIGSNNYFCR